LPDHHPEIFDRVFPGTLRCNEFSGQNVTLTKTKNNVNGMRSKTANRQSIEGYKNILVCMKR